MMNLQDTENDSLIPKVIHYCWFGGNPKSELIERCIASWRKYMPSYEIVEWNETNYDVTKATFAREAYDCKKWAFVSDYARFDIVNRYGGIYFDTDVELLQSIPESILMNQAFTGFEFAGKVNPGLVYAAVPNYHITAEIVRCYNGLHFLKNGEMILKTVNEIMSEILIPKGLHLNDTYQVIENMAIYPAEYFCGFDQDVKEVVITENTVSIHHYASSWNKLGAKQIVRKYIKKIFGVEAYRFLLHIKRRLLKK